MQRDQISLAALDHGFYCDDRRLPMVVAPTRAVRREWRSVVVASDVVAGSAYQADGRTPLPDEPRGEPWAFASSIARHMDLGQKVYTLDLCEADGALFLLEVNPFSGADLYACDRAAVVEAVSRFAVQSLGRQAEPSAQSAPIRP